MSSGRCWCPSSSRRILRSAKVAHALSHGIAGSNRRRPVCIAFDNRFRLYLTPFYFEVVLKKPVDAGRDKTAAGGFINQNRRALLAIAG
jgi:hypothetical protein